MEFVYQRDMKRRGQYYANLMFYEELMRNKDAVADPEQAALFFVPVMPVQMAGNLWHPMQFLANVVHYIKTTYPYWNRSNGTDHVFFLTMDRSGCWRPWETQQSLIITYFGFPASEAYFGFEQRLRWPRQGPNRHNNAYDVRHGSEATELDCYTPGKDVVVPVDANFKAEETKKLPAPGVPYQCDARRGKRHLLFMGGSMTNMGRVEYSQGVRQMIQRLHSNVSGFVLGGQFTFDDLRASEFCLAPSGWGWGWRLSLTMLTQCIPVIIQPNVTQPFEELIPYGDFAIRLEKEDIPKLPEILRAVPDEAMCRMQTNLAKYYRAILWQRPFGTQHPSAYDLTMVSLCKRARSLRAQYLADPSRRQTWLAKHELSCPDTLEAAGLRF